MAGFDSELKIDHRLVGPQRPTFVIAELSANHNQDLSVALNTVKAAKAAGADAIKLQTYTPDTITIDCDNEYFQIKQGTLWDGQTLHGLYKTAFTPWEWHSKLQEAARDEGLLLFSSPFDRSAVDFLESLKVPAYKIASFEITDIPLIRYVASKGKPVIVSTGIAGLTEIEDAVAAVRSEQNHQLALLKCTSAYPAPVEEAHLRTIPNMAETFGTVVGLSDHTLGIVVPLGAVALGARIVEKHFILDRSMGGPDSEFSLEPAEFGAMVRAIRDVEAALGQVSYELSEKQMRNRAFSRSLFAVSDISAGEKLTNANVRSIRPGFGLPPKHIDQILGKTARVAIPRGTPLRWDMFG